MFTVFKAQYSVDRISRPARARDAGEAREGQREASVGAASDSPGSSDSAMLTQQGKRKKLASECHTGPAPKQGKKRARGETSDSAMLTQQGKRQKLASECHTGPAPKKGKKRARGATSDSAMLTQQGKRKKLSSECHTGPARRKGKKRARGEYAEEDAPAVKVRRSVSGAPCFSRKEAKVSSARKRGKARKKKKTQSEAVESEVESDSDDCATAAFVAPEASDSPEGDVQIKGTKRCGNCLKVGHRVDTCRDCCATCGSEEHTYLYCTGENWQEARARAKRFRAVFKGGPRKPAKRDSKEKSMRKDTQEAIWAPQEYDPAYTDQTKRTPKKAEADKRHHHKSEAAEYSLLKLLSQDEAMRYEVFVEEGFLPVQTCNHCREPMTDVAVMEGKGAKLQCGQASCRRKEKQIRGSYTHSLMKGSLFADTHLSFDEVTSLLFCYAHDLGTELSSLVSGVSRPTCTRWFKRFDEEVAISQKDIREREFFGGGEEIEGDEAVLRKERTFDDDGVRVGTIHHSVFGFCSRTSTRAIYYPREPRFVAADRRGKPGPPPLPEINELQPLFDKHLRSGLVLHSDGAPAYASCTGVLRERGVGIVHDYVNHSCRQYRGFTRHVTEGLAGFDGWASPGFVELRQDVEQYEI